MPDDKDSQRRHTVRRVTSGFVLVAALTIVAVVGAVATGLSWTRPTHTTLIVHYTQSGQLTYSAQPGPTSVYGSAGLKTGQPIYLNTVANVGLTYRYTLTGTSAASVKGTEHLVASIDNAEGVTRSIQLQPPTHFQGTGFAVPVTLPVGQLAAIAQEFSTGGQTTGLYAVTIRPSVKVRGTLDGGSLVASFDQPVNFVLGNGMLAPRATPGVPAPGSKITATVPPSSPALNPTAAGKLVLKNASQAMLAGLPVKVLRIAAPILLLLAAAGALLAGRRLMQMLLGLDERGRIALRHGSSLVEVDTLPSDTGLVVVGLRSFDGLVHVARQLECPILQHRNGLGDDYVVVDNGTLYRYRVRSGRPRRVGRLVTSSRENGRHAAPGKNTASARARSSAGD